MPEKKSNNLLSIIPFLVVLSLSLLLLIFVGIGDANRVYPVLHINKIAAFGEIVQNPVNAFLFSGLPLSQFIGFQPLTDPLLASEKGLAGLEVVDSQGRVLFTNSQANLNPGDLSAGQDYADSRIIPDTRDFALAENDRFYRLTVLLSNKFETVGQLRVYSPKAIVKEDIRSRFRLVWIVGGGVVLLFMILLLVTFTRGGKWIKTALQVSNAAAFLILAGFIIFSLVTLYSNGIQGKTRALVNSLSQRLNRVIDLGLDLFDFRGIDEVFDEYRQVNPDISFVRLSLDDTIVINTDPAGINAPREKRTDHFEYEIRLNRNAYLKEGELIIGIGIPRNIIYRQLLRSGKNFLVLFFAAGFLSFLFVNLLMASRRKAASRESGAPGLSDGELKLELIRPLYFLAVFIEGLFVSFLPQFFQEITVKAGLGSDLVSVLFTIYFLAFVLSLVPAGRIADRGAVKGLLLSGAVMYTASYALLAFSGYFYLILVSRVLAGFGQGLLYIGVQSYILKVAPKEKKTKGTSVIVFGYNGGLISGTAIGALLVTYLGFKGVFIISSVTALFCIIYILLLVPGLAAGTAAAPAAGKEKSYFRNLGKVLTDFEFIKTILLVGIVTKAVLTGVNRFAMPLLLRDMNYLQEDIGQILIFYSAGVLLSTAFIAGQKDITGKSIRTLFWGTQLGGLGLYLAGMINQPLVAAIPLPYIQTVVIILGIFILGFGHGFIHAPIVTHISETRVAAKLGIGSTTSLYRLLERIGHVAGPVLVGQVLLALSSRALALSWIGIFTVLCGLLFLLFRSGSRQSRTGRRN